HHGGCSARGGGDGETSCAPASMSEGRTCHSQIALIHLLCRRLGDAAVQVAVGAMGYNARNDKIRDNITRMRREWEAQRGALATVRRFNATLSARGYVWFWPKIAAALTSKHHWLIIVCDSCGTVVDLDLRV